jgi:putative sigma-54 modulation protein
LQKPDFNIHLICQAGSAHRSFLTATAPFADQEARSMNIQIEGRHMKVSEQLDEYIHKKLDNVDRFFDGVHNLHVVLNMEDKKFRKCVEIVAGLVKGQTQVVHSEKEDMYAAIDDAVQKLKETLVKYKEKLRDRK